MNHEYGEENRTNKIGILSEQKSMLYEAGRGGSVF